MEGRVNPLVLVAMVLDGVADQIQQDLGEIPFDRVKTAMFKFGVTLITLYEKLMARGNEEFDIAYV